MSDNPEQGKPKSNLGEYLVKGGPGRPKGSENKVNKTMKEAIKAAFDELGGMEYLVEVGKQDPKTFLQIAAKIIPSEINADVKQTLKIVTGIQRGDKDGA